jgi:tRNA 2-thiouridine synthesizing protein A
MAQVSQSKPDRLVAKIIDATADRCPMPLLKAKRSMAEVQSGDVIQVLATDPGSVRDFQSLTRLAGHDVESEQIDGIWHHWITKA